jgi:hypothetical protein
MLFYYVASYDSATVLPATLEIFDVCASPETNPYPGEQRLG